MKWMPSIPTDNLYKFYAISGMWMFLGLVILYAWLVSIDINIEEESNATSAYYSSFFKLQEIELRLESIKGDQENENELEWVPTEWPIEQEKRFLEHARQSHQKTIEKTEYAINSDTAKSLQLLKRPVVFIPGILYISLMAFFLVIGFSRWKFKIQDIEIELREVELETKRRALVKLNCEIRKLNQNSRRWPR